MRSSVLGVILPLALAAPAFAQGTAAQRTACAPDAWRLCASSIPNVGAIAACLRRERAQLSAACRGVIEAADNAPSPPVAAEPEVRTAAKPAARAQVRSKEVRAKLEVKPGPEPRSRLVVKSASAKSASAKSNSTKPAPKAIAPEPAMSTAGPAGTGRPVRREADAGRAADRGSRRVADAPPAAGGRTAPRVIIRYVYVNKPVARSAGLRRASTKRPLPGRRYDSDMAEAMYWMRTVSSLGGSSGGLSLDGIMSMMPR